jgi:hypothetical protein
MSRNNRLSEFAKSLGKYVRPRTGEILQTSYGKARVSRVLPYETVIEEMRREGVPNRAIEDFDIRVSHFLGDKGRYFECELCYPDGEVDRIDWSEYLALRKRQKR